MAKRITIAYLTVGFLWIFIGDYRLEVFAEERNLDATQIYYIGLVKGLGYVLLTGLALFLYLRRSFNKISTLEKQYRKLFEENPNPMWVYDPQTLKFLAVNKIATLAYGYSEAEMLKMTLRDIRPPEELGMLEKQVASIKQDIINSGISKHQRKNGEVFFVNIYSGPTTFGKLNANLALALDVNEKKIADEQIIKLNNELSGFKQHLNKILSTVNDVVWSCKADTFTIDYVSDSSIKTFGYRPEEFYENSNLWVEIKHPEDQARDLDVREMILKNGSYENEYKITTRNGEIRTIYDKSVVQYDVNGKPKEVLGIATDITQLRESEQKLKSYADRIANIMDSISDGFITLDKEWKFTFVNKVFIGIAGKTKAELLGHSLWEVFPQLTQTVFATHLHEAVLKQTSKHFEEQYFGNQHWYSSSVYPNSDGLAIYFGDVTHTYQLRQEMLSVKNNLNALINNTADLIWSIGVDYKIISANDAYKKFINSLLGWSPNEGEDAIFKHLKGDSPIRWAGYYYKAFSGEAFSVEECYTMPDNKLRYFDVKFNPIFGDDNAVKGVGCFAREMTERKEYELKIEEQNKQLLEISWLQSHEVRAPLSIIMALINLFNKDNLSDPENIEILQMMDESTKKLDLIVHEIVRKSNEAKLANDDLLRQRALIQ